MDLHASHLHWITSKLAITVTVFYSLNHVMFQNNYAMLWVNVDCCLSYHLSCKLSFMCNVPDSCGYTSLESWWKEMFVSTHSKIQLDSKVRCKYNHLQGWPAWKPVPKMKVLCQCYWRYTMYCNSVKCSTTITELFGVWVVCTSVTSHTTLHALCSIHCKK